MAALLQPEPLKTRSVSKGVKRIVRFIYFNRDAQEVFVAGRFNNWNPGTTSLVPVGNGRWVKDVSLPPGRYEYQFVIDGRWLPDREALELVDNPLGGINSVVYVCHPQFHPVSVESPAASIDARWRWHHQVLLKVRDRLLEDRNEQLAEATEAVEPHSLHLADSASDEFDHERAIGQLNTKENSLYEVEQAIQRIILGQYGRCELTGKLIPAARLRAIPWTRFCKEIETELESRAAGH